MSLPAAWLARRGGQVTRGGALVGVALAAVTYAAFYLAGLLLVAVALALTLVATRTTRRRRDRLVPGEIDQRGAENILANCGVGALAAIAQILPLNVHPELTALCFATAIAAGASDTVASEIGKAFDARPRAFPTLRQVAPGTPGAVSPVGTFAGIVASVGIALPGLALWLLPVSALPIVVGCCLVGAFAESTLATAYEERGLVGNHALNLINTGVGAAAALLWWHS